MIRASIFVFFTAALFLQFSACSTSEIDEAPVAEQAVEQRDTTARQMAVAIAVISLDPQGWNDITEFLDGIPLSAEISLFYGNGHAATGTRSEVRTLLDSLQSSQSLQPSTEPPSLPYFSTALSSAVASSLRSQAQRVRTVVLGTFPPLEVRSTSELKRVGPIITRTELDALTSLADHQFVLIGPLDVSPLRDMLLRACMEARSSVTSISYSSESKP